MAVITCNILEADSKYVLLHPIITDLSAIRSMFYRIQSVRDGDFHTWLCYTPYGRSKKRQMERNF